MIRAWSGRFGRVTWLNRPVPMVLSWVRERRRPRGAYCGPALLHEDPAQPVVKGRFLTR